MILYLVTLTILFVAFPVQAEGSVNVTLSIRDTTGRPLANETIRIARFPETTPAIAPCTTSRDGRCQWRLTQGLYEVSWEHTLDMLSQIASAENGLHSFGITVGDHPITYHFVFHSDQHIYFDMAPTAPLPEPWIPTAERLFTHEPLIVEKTKIGKDVTIVDVSPSESTVISAIEVISPHHSDIGQIVLLIELGMLTGLTLYLWWRSSGGISHA